MRLCENRYTAAEALSRLPDGKGGFFLRWPGHLSLAERNGIVEELGDYVLRRPACSCRNTAKRWASHAWASTLSVQQLLVGNSAGHLLNLIRSTGIDPRLVTLEITESVLIQSIDQAAQAWKNSGRPACILRWTISAWGIPASTHLSNLPADIIKIDRSLTRQILTSPKQDALLKSIVKMAAINGLSVVAEGVKPGPSSRPSPNPACITSRAILRQAHAGRGAAQVSFP